MATSMASGMRGNAYPAEAAPRFRQRTFTGAGCRSEANGADAGGGYAFGVGFVLSVPACVIAAVICWTRLMRSSAADGDSTKRQAG